VLGVAELSVEDGVADVAEPRGVPQCSSLEVAAVVGLECCPVRHHLLVLAFVVIGRMD
jgi:hypothetical protein